MENWEEKLKYYQTGADIKDEELLDEAIAICEQIFDLSVGDGLLTDRLMHHSRPLVMSYLALKYIKSKQN